MLFRYLLLILLIAAVSAESKIDSMIGSTQEIIEKGPLVINKIFEEGKALNEQFKSDVVLSLTKNLEQFREALRDCEEDAKDPKNSILMLNNFSRLVQVAFKTFQNLKSTNFTKGMVALQRSLKNIQDEINRPLPRRSSNGFNEGYKPLELDFFR